MTALKSSPERCRRRHRMAGAGGCAGPEPRVVRFYWKFQCWSNQSALHVVAIAGGRRGDARPRRRRLSAGLRRPPLARTFWSKPRQVCPARLARQDKQRRTMWQRGSAVASKGAQDGTTGTTLGSPGRPGAVAGVGVAAITAGVRRVHRARARVSMTVRRRLPGLTLVRGAAGRRGRMPPWPPGRRPPTHAASAAAVRAGRRQVIVKRLPITAPYVADMSGVGLIEIIFMLLIPLAALWVVIYTAVRAAIRHSR